MSIPLSFDMSIINTLNRFRSSHGGRGLRRFWFVLGTIGRSVYKRLFPSRLVHKKISHYGPYLMDSEFIFSDFETWSRNHNSAFDEMIETAREKTCVFDVGAHIGLATMPLSTVVGKKGLVYAFEPAQANNIFLQRHIDVNNIHNVQIHKTLLGEDQSAQVSFLEYHRVSGMNSLALGNRGQGWNHTYRQMTTLDHFCAEYQLTPDMLKIDVEGAEHAILLGGKEIIQQAGPDIFLSVHPRHLVQLKSSVRELKSLILSLGYHIYNADNSTVNNEQLEFAEYILRIPT